MASVHEYKRLENKIVQKAKEAAVIAGSFFSFIFKGFGRFLTRRYTVVFVPHSEKKVYNLHITVLSVFCFLLVVFGILGVFFWYGASYSNNIYAISSKDNRLKDAQASLDQLRDETALLLKEARNFENALSSALSVLGADVRNSNSPNLSGDLSSLLSIREIPEGVIQEVDDIRQFSRYLSQTIGPIREIATVLDSQSALLTEIPSIWPIAGGTGIITMFFGQNINPFSGQYYIHKGIDIATFRQGDPIIASADGQVVTVDYDRDFGNYIIVKHKHGYYTRYAHLQAFRARVGQRVQQGEVIGYLGNTGLSTGPHLHYEVHIGSDVVDPFKYITIRSTIVRQGR
jgi:murein DD-endopeptidase MepM/ murein hydrolase activator NlpD